MLLGAVDLGSNSFRVEIGRLEGDSIHTQNYLKETVRLAGGFDDKGALTPEIQARALAALARFNERLAGLPSTQVRAVGTQAMRVATNAADFLKKAEETLGYRIDILSGHEEARLVFKGCAHTLPLSDKRRLVVDIGGASTEIIIGKGLEAQRYESFRMGCVVKAKLRRSRLIARLQLVPQNLRNLSLRLDAALTMSAMVQQARSEL